MDVGEAKHFTNLTASTDGFVLKGGRYALVVDIGDLDAVALEMSFNGIWLAVPSIETAPVESGDGGGTVEMSLSVDGMIVGDIPPGTYRLAVSGADTSPPAVASVVRIQS